MEDEDKFEDLAKRWPDLMQKSHQDYLGVGAGWYNIIDVLCSMLSSDVEQAKRQLKYAMENASSHSKPIAELEADLAQALEDLPVIMQIKEKFGGLRFYVGQTSEEQQAYIRFASAMASRTCEVCGNPGEIRHTNWMKTLCDVHHREKAAADKQFEPKKSRREVKLSYE